MKNFNKTPTCILVVILCLLLNSCRDKIKPKPNNKFWWEAGISAPKYYPIAGNVDFVNCAGNGSNVSFDNGWGFSYGSIVSGEKFKNLPKEVYIKYYSIVDAKDYKGTVALPYNKILALFNKYCKDKVNDKGLLTVGMAPGGWIRVWADFSGGKNGIVLIEIAKAQLKQYDSGYKRDIVINDKSWEEYYTYWQHFGIPYDAWAENEKTYDIYFNFNKPNPKYEVTDVLYSSLDGTIYYNIVNKDVMKNRKLPADLVIAWGNKKDTLYNQAHLLMPKNFTKTVATKKTSKVEIILEIEDNDKYGVLYLITNNKKEKILRFKNLQTQNDKGLGECDFTTEVEYYLK